jgi:hypothetical protein
MRLIDALRPRVQLSLHNADFDGAHFILSRALPDLAEQLADAAARRGIPMQAQPADCAGWASLREGVFVMPAAIPTRRHGASSAHYATRHGALTVTPEVPLFRIRAPSHPRPPPPPPSSKPPWTASRPA